MFDLRTTCNKVPVYDAAQDKHLRLYFEQETVRKHIKRLSLITNSAKLMKSEGVPDKVTQSERMSRQELLKYISEVRQKINKSKSINA